MQKREKPMYRTYKKNPKKLEFTFIGLKMLDEISEIYCEKCI